MKGCVGKIARKASEWRDRYRLGVVALRLGSGLADDPQEQPPVPHPIKPKDGKEEEK